MLQVGRRQLTARPDGSADNHNAELTDISVVIPAHDRDHLLARAIESALSQTLRPREIIIADDLGLESTRKLVDSHPEASMVRYLDTSGGPRIGPGMSRNAGASASDGAFIAFLDDDDQWHPRYLAEVRSRFEKGVGIVITWMQKELGGQRYPGGHIEVDVDFRTFRQYWGRGVTGSNTVVARDSFLQSGGYDEELWAMEDWDFFRRVLATGVDYRIVAEELVIQDANGSDHLSSKSLRAAAAAEFFLQKYRHVMTRQDLRRIKGHIHSMKRSRETPRPLRVVHLLAQLRYFEANDWRVSTIGRLRGEKPPLYK
jgi:glycosyltransferase involved in cell wall biosynthesis